MSQAKLGFQAKAYRQTSGTRAAWPGTGAAPNLAEVSNVKDLSIPLEAGEAEATVRGSGGFELVAAAIIKAGVEWEMVYDTTDTHMVALLAAFLARTNVALAFLDGSDVTVGVQGLWADFQVLKFEKMEPLNGVQSVKVAVKPAYSAVPPAWITVA